MALCSSLDFTTFVVAINSACCQGYMKLKARYAIPAILSVDRKVWERRSLSRLAFAYAHHREDTPSRDISWRVVQDKTRRWRF
jgi:hypothetical protein